MAQYEKVFTKPYEDGYENLPSQNTPITAQTLNDKDSAIEHIESFLDGKEFPTAEEESAWDGAVSDIEWYENNGFLSRNLFEPSAGDYYPSGISYVVNNNGTVTVDGYNSGRTYLAVGTLTGVSGKTVRLTGCPSGGNPSYSETGYCMFVGGSGQSVKYDSGEGLTFVPDGDSFTVYINVVNTQMDNVVFKPMVSFDTSTTYNDFTPYAPSNNALDTKKADITSIGTDESGRTTASKAYAIGEHFYKDGKFCTAKTAIASGGTFTLNTNYEEGDISTSLKSAEDTLNNDVLKCIQFGGNANKKFTFSINNSRFFVKLYGASGETVAYRAMFRIYLNYTLYNVWKETNSGNINDLSIAIVNNQLVITVPAYTEWQIEFKPNSGISLISQSTS